MWASKLRRAVLWPVAYQWVFLQRVQRDGGAVPRAACKLLAAFILVVVCFSLLFTSVAAQAEQMCDAAEPGSLRQNAMLWRLSKSGQPDHYLLGTLHVDGAWVELMLEDLVFIVDRTEHLFLELEMDGLTQLELAEHMLLPKPHNLTDYFTEAEFNTLKRLLYGRIDPKRLVAMKPWVAFAELYSLKSETKRTMDELLADYYYGDDKPVEGLETVARQLSVFDKLTYDQQAILVKRALALHQKQSEGLQANLFEHYKRGDLRNLWLLQEDFAQQMGEVFKPLHEATLAGRNHDMIKRFFMRRGDVPSLIAVGALHLPGEQGLICLFEQAGYQLTPYPMDPLGGFTDPRKGASSASSKVRSGISLTPSNDASRAPDTATTRIRRELRP